MTKERTDEATPLSWLREVYAGEWKHRVNSVNFIWLTKA
jgi:hypothetical protein